MKVCEENGCITAAGRCVVKLMGGKGKVDTDDIRIDIPFKQNAAHIKFGSRYGKTLPGGYQLNTYKLSVDLSEAKEFDIQNKLMPVYRDSEPGRFLYSIYDLKKGHNRNSRIIISGDKAVYFRQTIYNTMNLTVREANQYDTEEGQRRLDEALKKSAALKNEDIILMYEKNCSRYEESGSVLYERLIDAGYDNVYFIVDTDIPAVQDLPEKYRKNLIKKDSDKHLEYYFACKKFISSETIDHALQLWIQNSGPGSEKRRGTSCTGQSSRQRRRQDTSSIWREWTEAICISRDWQNSTLHTAMKERTGSSSCRPGAAGRRISLMRMLNRPDTTGCLNACMSPCLTS